MRTKIEDDAKVAAGRLAGYLAEDLRLLDIGSAIFGETAKKTSEIEKREVGGGV